MLFPLDLIDNPSYKARLPGENILLAAFFRRPFAYRRSPPLFYLVEGSGRRLDYKIEPYKAEPSQDLNLRTLAQTKILDVSWR